MAPNRFSAIIFAVCILCITVLTAANGPNMSTDVYAEPCKAAAKCYDVECRNSNGKKEAGFRQCFFQCLWSEVGFTPEGVSFFQEALQVIDFCLEKRGDKAPEGKITKCAMKKIKKDACEHYFGG